MKVAGIREVSATTITDIWQEGRKKMSESRYSKEQGSRRDVWTAKSKALSTGLRFGVGPSLRENKPSSALCPQALHSQANLIWCQSPLQSLRCNGVATEAFLHPSGYVKLFLPLRPQYRLPLLPGMPALQMAASLSSVT